VTGAKEATGTPRVDTRGALVGDAPVPEAGEPDEVAAAREGGEPLVSAVDGTRFAHASEAEMARILDFYAVRWEYEPTTFPILWNLEGDVVESFAPDFYLPDLEVFLEMTTLKQRLVRKKNRKLRRLRELYPDIRIKLFYARDFRAMMLKYGRLGLAESLSGALGQVVPDPAPVIELVDAPGDGEVEKAIEQVLPDAEVAFDAASAPIDRAVLPAIPRATPRSRPGRRRRRASLPTEAGAEREGNA
jgi:hypoxanthine phosphoribosyltransferase